MMIYNCLLQHASHFEFGFELEFKPLWCHNHLVTRVMHESQHHHNVMWVELILALTSKKYYKLGVIGKYGKYFLFIPKAFFCRNFVA